MPQRGELSLEADTIAVNHTLKPYATYKDLPLVSTGCDSYASWHPTFKDLSPMLTVDAIVERIMEILPFGEWRDEHLVITGGEPLLGWQRAYPDLLKHEKMRDLKAITFETNGTQLLSTELKEYLWTWAGIMGKGHSALTFSVSPKLSVSGESRKDAIKPDVIHQYEQVGFTYLKFVVASEDDANEALEVIKMYRSEGFRGPVYLMPVGGVESVYTMNNKNVALLAMKHGLRYSDRLQIPLFRNAWGT
jgi:7-carboxy-7-deazaguanine synthase